MAQDPHQGGRLEDMAEKGTSIPGDAGKQNLVSNLNNIGQSFKEPRRMLILSRFPQYLVPTRSTLRQTSPTRIQLMQPTTHLTFQEV